MGGMQSFLSQSELSNFSCILLANKIIRCINLPVFLCLYESFWRDWSRCFHCPIPGKQLRKIHERNIIWLTSNLRYQPPFRTVHGWIAVTLVVFMKTPINHIFFKSLIIPDYGFELTKTIYLNVFRNWNALCKSARLYKSCSTPAGNKRKKTINTAFASQHVPLKNHVSDFWQVRLFFFY